MVTKTSVGDLESEPDYDSEGSVEVEDDTARGTKRKHASNENVPAKKNKKLYQPPTVEELNQLRETQNLFNSNLFRLQIDEILKEISIPNKINQQVKSWFDYFKKTVNEIADNPKEYQLDDLSFLNKLKIKLPLNDLPAQTKGFFKYITPKSINIIHLYQSNCAILRPVVSVDINLEMPIKCFHKTDAINGRYLLKRAIYLGYLASKLSKNKKFNEIFYTYHNGNTLKPILLFKLKNIEFRVHVMVEQNLFKYSKFNASKNNVHGDWYFEHDNNFESSTPFYNSCILEDLTSVENNQILIESLKDANNIQDGLKLLQVWLRQRELDVGFGGFTPELMAMFVAYLVKSRRLNNAMSSYQVIRNVWVNLSESLWSDSGKGISLSTIKKENQPDLSEFHEHYPVVFVDVTGFYNLTAFLNPQVYLKVRDEAKKAVQYLDDNQNINSFAYLFIAKMQFYQQYDQILKVNLDKISKKYDKLIERHERLDYMTFKYPLWQKQLLSVLKRGLNERITLICPKLNDIRVWPTNQLPSASGHNQIIIGFTLNYEKAFNIIEKGPLANLPEAVEFREFWGKDKSELRRFNDGSITECVVWDSNPDLLIKHDVCVTIINYLLETKLQMNLKQVEHFCDQLPNLFNKRESEDVSVKITASYDTLVKKLRNLKDLPLDITAAHGASSIFSFTDVNPGLLITKIYPNFDKTKKPDVYKSIKPFEVVLHLALSGKWPNDLTALRNLKAAFYIKIAKQLESHHKHKCFVQTTFLDVIHDEWVFRLRILINKEFSLMKKTVDTDGVVKYRDTEESLELEQQLVHRPKLTSALLGVNSQHASYGQAARLTKRWLRSQLLDGSHVPDLVIDLLVASLYVTPEPYDIPTLPQIAFIRFLQKIIATDWQTDPLIINFNDELTTPEMNELNTTFNKTRQTLPPLFIITPYDAGKSIWTRVAPTQQVLVRVQMLAKESLAFIEQHIYQDSLTSCQALFKCSLSGYDVVIKLKTIIYNATKSNLSPTDKTTFKSNTIFAENPVLSFLHDLRDFYDEFALFFYNPFGGDVITVLWKPHVFDERDFKVSHVHARQLILKDGTDTPQLVLNKQAILDDFRILGNGLVESVDVMK